MNREMQSDEISELGRAKALFETALKSAQKADPAAAPFPLDSGQAALWHQAQASSLQWVLEMLP